MKIAEIVQGVFLAAITGLLGLLWESQKELAGELKAINFMINRNTKDISGLDDKFDRVDTKTVLNRVVIAELEAQCRRWIKDANKESKR